MAISKTAKSNIALSLAAFFWGTTFIFQRDAMDHLEPFAYGGIRFTIGGLALLPLLIPRVKAAQDSLNKEDFKATVRWWIIGGLVSGGFIFVGVSFQQYGLQWTTAGKAGFITSLYVVLVPLILRLGGNKILLGEAFGAVLAVTGLYFLSFTSGISGLSLGDGLVLIGAFVWAGHVISLGWLSPKMDPIALGAGQALVCGIFSTAAALFLGQWPDFAAIRGAWLNILWGGIFSVTLGFTLQVIGQKHANTTSAAIILQMEAVVAAVAGWYFLEESMTGRMLAGAGIMLAGMLLSQLWPALVKGWSAQKKVRPSG